MPQPPSPFALSAGRAQHGRSRRALAGGALIVAAALAACRGDDKRPDPGQTRATGDAAPSALPAPDALGRCVTTLERARRLQPNERAGTIVRGCPLCGVHFDPIIAADLAVEGAPIDREAVWQVVQACGGVCSTAAATRLRAGIAELGTGHPTIRPWRDLVEDCPAVMGSDRDRGRFASGAWYALATIARELTEARPAMAADLRARLDAALIDLVLPLPPRSASGNPLALPTGAGQRAVPWLALSIVGDDVHVGALPFAVLAADGLRLTSESIYPGAPVPAAGLRALVERLVGRGPGFAVDDPPGRLDRPVILAAHGAPARRVLDVVETVGTLPSYLAVTSAAPASMWPGQLAAHPVAMASGDPVRAPHLRVSLTTARVAAVDAAGKVLASAALPAPDQPMAARLYAAAAAMAPGGVVEVMAEEGTVAELAALLDAALRGGAAGVIPAPAGAAVTARPAPTFDGAALRALVTPP